MGVGAEVKTEHSPAPIEQNDIEEVTTMKRDESSTPPIQGKDEFEKADSEANPTSPADRANVDSGVGRDVVPASSAEIATSQDDGEAAARNARKNARTMAADKRRTEVEARKMQRENVSFANPFEIAEPR